MKTLPLLPVSIGLFVQRESSSHTNLWMQTRHEQGELNGLWEFPGGKIEAGETPQQALIREIAEETDVIINEDQVFPFKIIPYEHREKKILLHVFVIKESSGPNAVKGKWFSFSGPADHEKLRGQIPGINHQVIEETLLWMKEQFL